MGTWGPLAFDNDDANDWAYDLEKARGLDFLESTLTQFEQEALDYLEAETACQALAVCEVVARLRGRSGYRNAYTKKVDDWVEANPEPPSPQLVARSLAALDRVLGQNSELLELWEESGTHEWLQALQDLRARLSEA